MALITVLRGYVELFLLTPQLIYKFLMIFSQK